MTSVFKRERVCTRLVIFVPGQGLGGEDEPVLLGSSLHDADVVDGQPALPDHLTNTQTIMESDYE